MKKLLYSLLGLVFLTSALALSPMSVSAAVSLSADTLIKTADSPTVYYYAADGKRYAFPNNKVYASWFIDFSNITVISADDLAQIPLGGVVRYRPGVLLLKISTDPKVYAVGGNGTLRWVQTEQLAKALYGDDWNTLIDDLPVAFFVQYFVGLPILSLSDFNPSSEVNQTPTISHDRGLHLGQIKRGADTEKCRAIPAMPAKKLGKKGPAIPAISARDCARAKHDDDNDNQNNHGLVLSNVSVSASTSTASIMWTTNQDSSSLVTYNTAHVAVATSTNQTASSSSLVKTHSLSLSGLTPATVYFYQVQSTNASGTSVMSTEKMFTTLSVSAPDVTPPVITNATATPGITSAVVTWTTNEAATSEVNYADESLATATTSQTSSNSTLVTSHSRTLTGLTASTTYYFIIKSADSSGNLATTTEATFTTMPPVDTTSPVISSIVATPGSTTSTVTWLTNEAATSKVKYSLDPLATAVVILNISSSSLVTSHSLDLTGLSASSTYYFMVESADASSNLATSTQQSFVTML